METKPLGFSFEMILAVIIAIILLLLIANIYINQKNIEEKREFAGAPGVVRADNVKIKYKDADTTHKNLKLTMINVEHEEGKILEAVPVISVSAPDIVIGEFLYIPVSKKEGEEKSYPSYLLTTDTTIEAYYEYVFLSDIRDGQKLHLSLWQKPCLEKIGFTRPVPTDLNYAGLVEKCSGSYLGAWYAKLEPEEASEEITTA